MHFLKSSMSFSRFKVIGKFAFAQEEFQTSLEQNSFRELGTSLEEESIGWVSPENCLQSPMVDEMLIEPYLKLVMRVDRKRIPKALLTGHIQIEEKARLEVTGRDKLSVKERKELRQSAKEFLLERCTPSSSLYQALWNFSTGTCFLFSTGKGVHAHFRKLFRTTFTLDLEPLSPWNFANFWAHENNATKILEIAEPCSFQKPKKPQRDEQ